MAAGEGEARQPLRPREADEPNNVTQVADGPLAVQEPGKLYPLVLIQIYDEHLVGLYHVPGRVQGGRALPAGGSGGVPLIPDKHYSGGRVGRDSALLQQRQRAGHRRLVSRQAGRDDVLPTRRPGRGAQTRQCHLPLGNRATLCSNRCDSAHRQAPRSQEPFSTVNYTNLPLTASEKSTFLQTNTIILARLGLPVWAYPSGPARRPRPPLRPQPPAPCGILNLESTAHSGTPFRSTRTCSIP